MAAPQAQPSRTVVGAVTGIGVVTGLVVAIVTADVILGVIAGASFISITVGVMRLWFGGGTQRPHHS